MNIMLKKLNSKLRFKLTFYSTWHFSNHKKAKKFKVPRLVPASRLTSTTHTAY